MKLYLNKVALVILLSLFTFACKKDKKSDPVPNPVPTPSSWFKAKVGNVIDFNGDTLKSSVDTILYQNRKITQVSCLDAANYKMILSFESRDTGSFVLGNSGTLNYLRFIDPNENVWSSIPQSGSLHITKYDKVENTISGVFSGSIKKFSPPFDTIVVTNGEFENIEIFK